MKKFILTSPSITYGIKILAEVLSIELDRRLIIIDPVSGNARYRCKLNINSSPGSFRILCNRDDGGENLSITSKDDGLELTLHYDKNSGYESDSEIIRSREILLPESLVDDRILQADSIEDVLLLMEISGGGRFEVLE